MVADILKNWLLINKLFDISLNKKNKLRFEQCTGHVVNSVLPM